MRTSPALLLGIIAVACGATPGARDEATISRLTSDGAAAAPAVLALAGPQISLVRRNGGGFDAVALSPSGVELYRRGPVLALGVGEGVGFVAREESKDTLVLERLEADGSTRWSAPLGFKLRALSVHVAAGMVVALAEDGDERWLWSAEAERGANPTGAVRLGALKLGFVDERAVVWAARGADVVRIHPGGLELSSTRAALPPADPSRTVAVTELFARPGGGAVALVADARAAVFDAEGRLVADVSLPEPVRAVAKRAGKSQRLLQTRRHVVALSEDGSGVAWQWRSPSGPIDGLDAGGDLLKVKLASGSLVSLDEGGRAVSAATRAGWGTHEQPGLAVDLAMLGARRDAKLLRFQRVGDGSSSSTALVAGGGAVFSAAEPAKLARVEADRLTALKVKPLPGKSPYSEPQAFLLGDKLHFGFVLAHEVEEFVSVHESVDVFRVEGDRLVRVPELDAEFPFQATWGKVLAESEGDVALVCAATFTWPEQCTLQAKGKTSKLEVDASIRAIAVKDGRPYVLSVGEGSASRLEVFEAAGPRDLGYAAAVDPTDLVVHSPSDIWVFASGADRRTFSTAEQALYHFDGKQWSAVALPMVGVRDIWASRPGELYAAGTDGLAVFDGQGWARVEGAPSPLFAVTGSGGKLIVQGSGGTFVGRPVGGDVTPSDEVVSAAFDERRAGPAEPLPVAKGPSRLVRADSALASQAGFSLAGLPLLSPVSGMAVRASAASPVGTLWLAIASDGATDEPTLFARTPTSVRRYPSVPAWTFAALAAKSDSDVWLAGGIADPIESFVRPPYTSPWPIGLGALVHFDGAQFAATRVGSGALLAVHATGPGEAWAVGAGGGLVRATAKETRSFVIEGAPTLRAVLARSATDVFMCGDDATALHFDGKKLSKIDASGVRKAATFTSIFVREGAIHLSGPDGTFRVE